MSQEYEQLKIENQLCFPLYACAKEIVRQYRKPLEELNLTYTQYIVMMVLWEHRELTVKQIGEYLLLDSGTLTPVLKTLEKKGYVTRERSREDERIMIAKVTQKGMELREQAVKVPGQVGSCIDLTTEEAGQLYSLLYKILQMM